MSEPIDIISVRSPALAALAGISTYVDLASEQTASVDSEIWPGHSTWALAVALLAMHMAQLDQTRLLGEAGAIVSKKEGASAMSFSDKSRSRSASMDDDLDQTAWGTQLIGLRDRLVMPILVAGGDVPDAAWEMELWGDGT